MFQNLIFNSPKCSYTKNQVFLQEYWKQLKNEKRPFKIPFMWIQSYSESDKLFIYFHANSTDIGQCMTMAESLSSCFNAHVILMEYRGYGLVKNLHASEKSIYKDAEDLYKFIINKLKFKSKNINIIGRSLGSAVAINLCKKFQVESLTLISPFMSIRKVVKDKFGFLSFLVKDIMKNDKNIQNVKCPVLIIHGKKDKTVKLYQAQKLYELIKTEKKLSIKKEMTHNEFYWYEDIFEEIGNFLEMKLNKTSFLGIKNTNSVLDISEKTSFLSCKQFKISFANQEFLNQCKVNQQKLFQTFFYGFFFNNYQYEINQNNKMPQAYAIVGIKEKKNQPELNQIQNATKGLCKVTHMKILQQSKFKLGSLDSMLLNLERVKKIELAATNFLKRTVKMYQEIVPDKDLFENKLDSNVAPRSIDNYLKNFEWDDIRFPRSASLFDQIKNIEEKLNNIEKNLKIKYQNYQDSKTVIQNNFDKKESLNNFINKDPNDIIFDLLSTGKCRLKPSDFIFTDYLQSFIVYIPEQELENFQQNYESLNDQIVPNSFAEITRKYGYVMGQIVAFKLAQDDIKIQFKSKLKTFVKEFQMDQKLAKENAEQKQSIMSQNKTDKDLLESACKDSFKRAMVMIIHVNVYLIIIDASLRFGSFDNFGVFLMFFDAGKKPRIIQKLIQRYAEKDKTEFYGTKEQLNDVEDFFPFVWTDFTLKVQQNLQIKNRNFFNNVKLSKKKYFTT